MPCYRPLEAWRSKNLTKNGKRGITFTISEAYSDIPIELPCGQCIGCKLERSRQWAIRCVNEASLHDDNCFITLTYSPENLPVDGSLNKRDFQLFMKRLRKKFPDKKIKYFHCGEYGEKYERPHYHACIFNFDFSDRVHYKTTNGVKIYTSETLNTLWGLGFCTTGNVTFESAAYVARYITKKITGPGAADHYNGREPEYTTMSRRPGIGKEFYDLYKDEIFPDDFMVINGKKVGVPKFYENQVDQEQLRELKLKRMYKAYQHKDNSTYHRLIVREKVHEARCQLLKRSFEND